MKRAIEVRDIREGDLIRWEKGEFAYEWRTNQDREQRGMGDGQHYLLDRPTPPVDLPTDHPGTLGWANTRNGYSILGYWRDVPSEERISLQDGSGQAYTTLDQTTPFTPATAVPTSALDEFIARVGKCEPNTITGRFRAAIDAAGSGA